MLTGINIYETRPYISKYDPDKNNPTVFHVGLLEPNLRAVIEDQSVVFERSSQNPDDPVKANTNLGIQNIMAVRFGIKNIENFIHPKTGQPVKFDTISISIKGKNYAGVTDEIIQMLGKKLIDELAFEILSENKLTEEERKN